MEVNSAHSALIRTMPFVAARAIVEIVPLLFFATPSRGEYFNKCTQNTSYGKVTFEIACSSKPQVDNTGVALSHVYWPTAYPNGIPSLVVPGSMVWASGGSGQDYMVVLTTIRSAAFSNDTGIQTLSIPLPYVKTIAVPFAKGCSALTQIQINQNANYYNAGTQYTFATVDGVLYDKEKTRLFKYPEGKTATTFSVPSTVTNLLKGCFANAKLQTVTFSGAPPVADSTAFDGSSAVCLYPQGASGWSSTLGGANAYAIPKAVANVKASQGTSLTQVTVTWSANAVAKSYIVYRSESTSGTKVELGTISAGSTVFTDYYATAGKKYYYWVKAVNGPAEGALSSSSQGWVREPDVTVTFLANASDASVSALTGVYSPGSTYGTLPNATRPGYSFAGWYTAASGGTKITTSSTVTSSYTSLYAHWTVNTYTITYMPGANGTGSQKTAKKNHDVTLTLKGAIFTRTGYTQTGWATNDGGAMAYDLSASYTANASITLYPVWKQDITYYVDAATGNDGNDGLSWATAKHSIQATIDIARDGDNILVNDGRYEPISTANKRIEIRSVNGAESTIIDASIQWPRGITNRCATLGSSSSHTNSVLYGFCLTNGIDSIGGGSLYGTLNNCTLSGNTAANNGGGSLYGTLNNCTLSGNTAANNGGGSNSGTLNNCKLIGNTGSYGGGSYSGTLNNCTLSGNTANSSGGGSRGGTLNNCIVWGNTATTSNAVYGSTCRYSCLDEEVAGVGDIVADPMFFDAENGDYRLQAGSPCIDAGANAYVIDENDIDGNPRIVNGRVDMGAYEFDPDAPATSLVTLDFQSGSGGTASVTATYGAAMPAITPPTRGGYTFGGYWTEPNGGGTQYYTTNGESARPCDLTGNTTLYAKWNKALPTDGDLYVDAAMGDDANDGLSWATAKASIQSAIDLSKEGDLIIVNDGRYEPISTSNKRIEIRSVNGAESTIIDASLQWPQGVTNRCVTLGSSYSHTNSVLYGFCLTNGIANNGGGGGSYSGTLNNCTLSGNSANDGGGSAGGTLNNCTLTGNTSSYGGGGSYYGTLNNCTLSGNTAKSYGGGSYAGTLNNCTLSGNTAYDGGGSYYGSLNDCTLSGNTAHYCGGGTFYGTLNDCTLSRNTVDYYGGGSYHGTLNNCTLTGNTASEGGGSAGGTLNNCALSGNTANSSGGGSAGGTLNNCTLSGNSANDGGGSDGGTLNNCTLSGNTAKSYGGGSYAGTLNNCTLSGNSASFGGGSAEGTLNNCILWGNLAGNDTYESFGVHSCAGGNLRGVGNICADPLFADAGNGNFRLLSGSPCIDAGWCPWSDEMGVDLDGNPRWQGSQIDMGAYESAGTTFTLATRPEKTWNVDAVNGDDANDGETAATAMQSIQAAIKKSRDGDTILVAPGTYTPIATLDMRILIMATQGSDVTAIDGGGATRCATLGTSTNTVLSSFSLANGNAYYGGGSYYGTLNNCALTGNTAHEGGGSYCGTLNNCTLNGNTAHFGGGSCYGTLNNCTLSGNTAYYGGGSESGTLNNCTLSGNTAKYGGGSAFGTLNNCIALGNTASTSNAVYRSTCRHSCLDEEVSGEGNIVADPMFFDAENGDYRLKAGSTCIDAGTNYYAIGETDLAGNPRILNGMVDMGAYEFDPDAAATSLVTLDFQSGSGGTASVTATYGAAMPAITPPTRDGYTFGGYWTEPNGGGTQYYTANGESARTCDLSGNTTLYAKWNRTLPTDGDLYVDADRGDDTNDGRSWATAKASIQAAIDAAAAGDLIIVNDGRYERIITYDKRIEIRSVNGAEATIIDASLQWSCVCIGWEPIWNYETNEPATNSVLSGFCLINGKSYGGGGGAQGGTLNNCILKENHATYGGGASDAILNNCILRGNSASVDGGGSYNAILNNCKLIRNTVSDELGRGFCSGGGSYGGTLSNCTLIGNTAYYNGYGGGASEAILNNCILTENNATRGGGSHGGTLNNCTLTKNTASEGGGSSGGVLNNCTLSWNTASSSGGGSSGGVLNNCTLAGNTASRNGGASAGNLNNCIIWGNTAETGEGNDISMSIGFHSCSGDDIPGTGNIRATPLFIDAENGDFRLRPDSPCIDAGWRPWSEDLGTDLDGNPRWQGAQVDIGAYESEGAAYIPESRPAKTWHIDAANGDDANDGETAATGLRSIQAAVERSRDGDTILVTPGTYAHIATMDLRIRIESTEGAAETTIDGGGTTRCATLGMTTNTVVSGFLLTNGNAAYGGGSYYGTLNNCTLSGNTASSEGGGSNYGTLNNCTLSGNTAKDGGGSCGGTLNNCTLSENTAVFGGGSCDGTLNNCALSGNTALYSGGGSYGGTLSNCTLSGNTATEGGGGAGGWTTLNNCILSGNTAKYGGGASHGTLNNCTLSGNTTSSEGGGASYGILNNCIVWGNTAQTSNAVYCSTCNYSCLDENVSGQGNICADPLFADAENGDYRLLADSPCIDAGTNYFAVCDTDLAGNPRILNGTVDMGAYEFDPSSALPATTFAVALDNALDWTSGGNAEWTVVDDASAVGGSCARSGAIGDSQTTWVETEVNGPGEVSFRWKVSSQARMDRLSFLIDGVSKAFISGTRDWAETSFEIEGDGSHSLRWAYAKSPSGTAGEDCGWLDDVRWSPRNAGAVFGAALEAPDLAWSSGGDDASPWVVVDSPSFDGDDACAAYAYGATGVARIATEVEGAGTISFRWRVEPGTAFAGIALMVDGVDVDYCEQDNWALCEYAVAGEGTHSLAWEFFWDGEPDGDAGYLDCVKWMPEGVVVGKVTIPETWFSTEAASILASNGGNYEAAANATAANGVNKVWECYVAGISPTNETQVFRTVISWENGEPKISWEPKLTAEEESKRVYTEIGKTNLTDNGWTDVSSTNRDGMRFFKVKVEMK